MRAKALTFRRTSIAYSIFSATLVRTSSHTKVYEVNFRDLIQALDLLNARAVVDDCEIAIWHDRSQVQRTLSLKCIIASLPGADTHGLGHLEDKNLAVTNFIGMGRLLNGLDNTIHLNVIDYQV